MNKKNGIILIVILVIVIAFIGGLWCANTLWGFDKNKTENATTSESNNDKNLVLTEENGKYDYLDKKEAQFVYSSGDNAAIEGNPELLYVYEFNDDVIEFKYFAPWMENDIKGVANKVEIGKYEYVNGEYKIELLLDAMGENSIKVTEFEKNELASWKYLWK